jgi:TPR repeat protein
MYEDGEAVPRNYVMAAMWYRRAAEHGPNFGGAAQGRNNLGLLYMQGLGVPKDLVRAYMWFRLAHTDSNLSYARSQLKPSQILDAERMATEWEKHHPRQ